ncbi:lysophospholipid acyltransferase family protein [Modestobacter sp. VKM Ac-2985]|uniref:lysophospholipid acyltransferase family protein n=1 Tax=Modestobacter sp. VKM Ac-2985 TaxID=3004139 RepID=UPI0022AB81C5|nr:lysophospholipid acyltransferase family protein [Modestobacter sp. VKM Ac-2985]MCZ2838862.1 lysophospholipid acyltransferase family protein [Modestobacter sp. VKM Ac-2985]
MSEHLSPSAATVPAPRDRRPSRRRTRRPVPWALRLCVAVVYPSASAAFRLRYHHADRIPPTGGVLLVANHVSVLDPLACARLVWDAGRAPHFLAKDTLFSGVAGAILRGAGQIPVSRGSSAASSSVHAAKAALDAGDVVVVYPEGSVTRDPDWWPMQARSGVARLALTTEAMVLPVAQWGPQRVHDYHTKTLHRRLRTPVEHLVGEPIDLSEQRARVRAGAPLTPELLREVTDLLMARVRDQLGELRGEQPPAQFHPRPSRTLPGDLPGAAA